jgi:hypothetical protein
VDPFCKITNLGKSKVEVDVNLVVIDFIDKLLHYQVDDVSEAVEVTSLSLIRFLRRVYFMILLNPQLIQLLQTFCHRTIVGSTIGGHTKKVCHNAIVTQSLQDNTGHIFAGVMIE